MSETKSGSGSAGFGRPSRLSTRRGGISLRRLPLDPRLQTFCNQVWDRFKPANRDITKEDVYALYALFSGGAQVEQKAYRKYLSDLLSMTLGLAVTVQFGNQMVTDPKFKDLFTAYTGGLSGLAALESKTAPTALPTAVHTMLTEIDPSTGSNSPQLTEAFKKHLEGAFFHCSLAGGTRPVAAQRVYLNVTPVGALYVFGFVLSDCVKGMPEAVSQAKIIGPAKIGSRPDAIVIYTKDTAGAEAVVAKLREWAKAKGRAAYFAEGVPPMTLPVAGLAGVSLGAEPTMPVEGKLMLTIPSYIERYFDDTSWEEKVRHHATTQEPRYGRGNEQPFVQGPVSFGSLRSDLIAKAFNAAREDKEGQTLEFFLELVWRYFGSAGLNVLMPHL